MSLAVSPWKRPWSRLSPLAVTEPGVPLESRHGRLPTHSHAMPSRQRLIPLSLLLLAPSAIGQGELCSNPQSLSGLGTFAFDTTGFDPSSIDEAQGCAISFGPGTNLDGDGFFTWSAPFAGDFLFITEGRFPWGQIWRTQLAIYDGDDCGATCIANDNASGPNQGSLIRLQSVAAGETFLIQIGGYNFFNDGNPTTYQGPGTLEIIETPAVCQNPVDDSFEDNDSCATPTAITPGTYTDLFLSISDPDYYAVTIPPGEAIEVELLTSSIDLLFFVYDDSCHLIGIEFDRWIQSNPTSVPQTIVIEPRRSLTAAAIPCASYDIRLALGADPCIGLAEDPFEPNDFSNTAAPLGDGFYPGLTLSQVNHLGLPEVDYFAFDVPPGATVQCVAVFEDAKANIDMLLLNQNGNILSAGNSDTDNETVQWTNTTGTTFPARLSIYIAGVGSQSCSVYDLGVGGLSGGKGAPFCLALNNSTGVPTLMEGSATAAGAGLHLEVVNGPPLGLGMIVAGDTLASSPAIVGSGALCLSSVAGVSMVYRYNVIGGALNSIGRFDGQGVLQNVAGSSTTGSGFDVPAMLPGGSAITAGQTLYFQCWHRDTAGSAPTSNFSNGVSLTF